MNSKYFFEKTLKTSLSFSGKGLFSGKEAQVILHPAETQTGILFKKKHGSRSTLIPALNSNVHSVVNRNTTLSNGLEQECIHCVEHLMSALFGCEISNVVIEIEGSEVPILDGSAKPFVEAILECGVVNQGVKMSPLRIDQPYHWSKGNVHIIALPSDELRFSYTLSYEGHPMLSSQFFTFPFADYANQVAPARTFCLYEEAVELLELGKILGGSLHSALVIKGDEVINPEGLRFSNEMARHKVLDMIGDFALIGRPLMGHFIGIRSGHEANANLVEKIVTNIQVSQENLVGGAYL